METNVKEVEICKADNGQWYFNAIAGNGEVVSTSELYTTKDDAERGASGVFPGVLQIVEDEEVKDGS